MVMTLPGFQPYRRATLAPTMHSLRTSGVQRPSTICQAGLTAWTPVVAIRHLVSIRMGEPDSLDFERAILRGDRGRESR